MSRFEFFEVLLKLFSASFSFFLSFFSKFEFLFAFVIHVRYLGCHHGCDYIDFFFTFSSHNCTRLRRVRCCEFVVRFVRSSRRAVQQSSRGVERGVGIENKLKKLNVWKGNSSCSFVEILGGGAC